MTDPDKVAMVIPVDPKTAPSQIAPGDWLDLVVGLAPGNISVGKQHDLFEFARAADACIADCSVRSDSDGWSTRPVPTLPPNPSGSIRATNAGNVGATDMNLPADKVVIQNVPVLAVRFQQVPNPAFTGSGAGFGRSQSV